MDRVQFCYDYTLGFGAKNAPKHTKMLALYPLVLLLALAVSGCGATHSANIVSNPGFENGSTGWVLDPPNCQVVTDRAHSGRSSLKIGTSDPAVYKLTYVNPPMVPGRKYKLSCWIRTENVAGPEHSGASLLMSIYGKNDRWLADVRTERISGTTDWTLVTAQCDNLRRDAHTVHMYLLMDEGCTGTAWFDDVVVEDVLTLNAVVRHPIDSKRVRDELVLGLEVQDTVLRPKSALSINVKLKDSDGKTIVQPKILNISGKSWENVRISLKGLSHGDYSIVTELVEKATGAVLDTKTINFTAVAPSTSHPKVRFDEYGRCFVDGKLFFPRGFFDNIDHADSADLDRMAAMRMNCVLNYRTNMMSTSATRNYLDAADSRNLKVIFSVKDSLEGSQFEFSRLGHWTGAFNVFKGLVDTFKSHPAILAWYVNDEQYQDAFLKPLQARHDYIKDNDPDHPVYQVFEQNNCPTRKFLDTLDIAGADCYPVKTQDEIGAASPDLYRFEDLTRFIRSDILDSRPVWMVQECTSQQPYMPEGRISRPPTYEEITATSCLALISGARGILFFEYALMKKSGPESQLDVMRRVGEQLELLSPFALALDAPERQQVTPSHPAIRALTRRVGSELWVLAVNPSDERVTSTFVLGSDVAATCASVGAVTMPIQDGSFSDKIEAFGTRVYRLTAP